MRISNELLNEVLGKEVEIRGCLDKFIPADFQYIEDMVSVKTINIYELGEMCKKWAYENGYFIEVNYNLISIFNYKNDDYEESFICTYFEDILEYEIKACQWILENKQIG